MLEIINKLTEIRKNAPKELKEGLLETIDLLQVYDVNVRDITRQASIILKMYRNGALKQQKKTGSRMIQ